MGLSIRNQIQNAVRERMEDITTNKGKVFGPNSTLLTQSTLSGTYLGIGYVRFKVVVETLTDVRIYQEFEEKDSVDLGLFPIANQIELIVGECFLDIANTKPLVVGNIVNIRFNDKTFSVRQALRYEVTQPNKIYPSITVLPIDEFLNKMISDRYARELKLGLEVKIDRENRFFADLEEAMADVEKEFQRSHHLFGEDKVNSLCWEVFIDRIQLFNTEYTSEWFGFILFVCVKYRTREFDPRIPRN